MPSRFSSFVNLSHLKHHGNNDDSNNSKSSSSSNKLTSNPSSSLSGGSSNIHHSSHTAQSSSIPQNISFHSSPTVSTSTQSHSATCNNNSNIHSTNNNNNNNNNNIINNNNANSFGSSPMNPTPNSRKSFLGFSVRKTSTNESDVSIMSDDHHHPNLHNNRSSTPNFRQKSFIKFPSFIKWSYEFELKRFFT
ncbi:unnamed protein product [[Candida] boidinii]|uniref:Unnamed protein product n=1 Tax=Candida boidinii TaxID=5477 RepID=A0A9W6T5E8_CANBO|nr:unnamed protein product [[Candida] boidinii]